MMQACVGGARGFLEPSVLHKLKKQGATKVYESLTIRWNDRSMSQKDIPNGRPDFANFLEYVKKQRIFDLLPKEH